MIRACTRILNACVSLCVWNWTVWLPVDIYGRVTAEGWISGCKGARKDISVRNYVEHNAKIIWYDLAMVMRAGTSERRRWRWKAELNVKAQNYELWRLTTRKKRWSKLEHFLIFLVLHGHVERLSVTRECDCYVVIKTKLKWVLLMQIIY